MTLNGQAIFSQAISGLSNTYSSFSKYYPNGLTLENLANPTDELMSAYSTNYSFIQYLQTNFSSIDKDGDGVINANDFNNLTNSIQNDGLTYEQITQLCASGYGTNTLLETVLMNFNAIDKNKDGKVTSEEIAAYGAEEDRAEAEKEYNSYKPSNMTLFYYEDGVNLKDDDVKYSVLDSKYTSTSKSSKS